VIFGAKQTFCKYGLAVYPVAIAFGESAVSFRKDKLAEDGLNVESDERTATFVVLIQGLQELAAFRSQTSGLVHGDVNILDAPVG
jgi:hypothetical protein